MASRQQQSARIENLSKQEGLSEELKTLCEAICDIYERIGNLHKNDIDLTEKLSRVAKAVGIE